MLFEQYRMTLKRDKYNIEVRDDDAINRNQVFFDFMQQTFKSLDGLYMDERFILMDTKNNINGGSRLQRKLK